MNKNERYIIIASIIITILFNELFIFGGIGISVPIYLFIYYFMIFMYCKKAEIRIDLKKNKLFIPIILCSLCFILFDNSLLMYLNVLFLWFMIIMNTSDILQINQEEEYSLRTLINIYEISVIYPFKNISKCICIIKSGVEEKCKNKLIIFSKVGVGLILGLMLLVIVIPLLISSDAAFSGMIRLIIENLNFNFIFKIFKRVIVCFMIFFPIYSFAYGITHKNSDINITKVSDKKIKFDFTIVITLISVIVAIYLLFCISQFSYFISAFQGILPKDYSYSQYARKGFFECIPLSLINFMFIILLNKLCYQNESGYKKVLIRAYSFFICSISLFLVITAISKLVLYMRVYGLTILRIYSAWFLIVLSLILIAVYLNSFYNKINLFKNIFVIFTTMFLVLNYINPDYIVAKYNTMLDKKDKFDTIQTFENLSLSAAEPLCNLDINYYNNKNNDVVNYYNSMKNKYRKKISNKREWYQWNLAKYKAEKMFEERDGVRAW